MRLWINLFALLLLSFFPALAQGQEDVHIEVDASDRPLIVTGRLGESGAFTGNLRLTAVGGDVAEFTFLPSDLRRDEGDEIVGRQHVSLVGEPSLTAGVPRDFQVLVSGTIVPGTYQGRLEFLLPGQPRSEALVVDLTVVATARPTLTPLPGAAQLQLRLVNCARGLDCALARGLLPASAFLESWQLQFDNTGLADATIADAEVALLGERTEYQLGASALTLPDDGPTLPAGEISDVPLTLHRSEMPPDHYTGAIYLALAEGDGRLTIPVDLNVRVGPFWPLVALAIGIVIGRLFRYMQERGEPQVDALQKVNEVEILLQDLHPDDRELLLPMLNKVRQSVYQEELETVEARLAAIKDRLSALEKLRAMGSALEDKEQHPKAQEALAKIELARQRLARQEDAAAAELLKEIGELLAALANTMMSAEGEPDPALVTAAGEAGEAGAAAERASTTQPAAPTVSRRWERAKQWLIWLSGLSDEIRAEATLWLVRPLLYAVLLLGLLAVGLESFYVDKGLTFGATPFSDYVGLVLWGLSADVVGRTLANLRPQAG